jgi:hypothetical protein
MKFKNKKTGEIKEFDAIMINAALVSAQNRKRLFWTNISNVTQPKDRGILLRDILESNVDESYSVKNQGKVIVRKVDKSHSLMTRDYKGFGNQEMTGILTNSWEHNNKLSDNEIIRKLTPVECERLQGLAEKEQSCIIRVCKDNQNNSVSVANQNPKSQGVAGNAEKTELLETAKSVVRSLNIKNPPTNKPVQPDVLINCEENKIEIFNQGKLLANVSGVELKQNAPPLKSIEDFVRIVVGLNTIVERTTPFGEAELPQKSNLLVVKESGNNVANIYGKGITQLAEDAKIDLTILKKLLKSTTSDLIGRENKEQITQILFSCVALAIVGYIPKEIQNQNILTFQIKSRVGYTFGVSNTQRYKALGNAFNCEVVKHILKNII